MIHARQQLFSLVRAMFDGHLRGLYCWDDLVMHVPEAVDNSPGRSRRPFGKFKEVVSVRFGDYDLTLESSHERPPLGRVTLTGPAGTIEEQSLDSAVLDRIGEIIKSHHEELKAYG